MHPRLKSSTRSRPLRASGGSVCGVSRRKGVRGTYTLSARGGFKPVTSHVVGSGDIRHVTVGIRQVTGARTDAEGQR